MTLAYVPSSAGSTGNPPVAIASLVGRLTTDRTDSLAPGTLWLYNSTNTLAELAAAGTITDAGSLRIQNGDPVIVIQATAGSTAPLVGIGAFTLSSAGATAAALSTGYCTSTAA